MRFVAGVLLSAAATATQNSRTCIVNTGHTCRSSNACPNDIGDVYCDTSFFDNPRCFCNAGSCVGDDGTDDSNGKRGPGKCHAGKTNSVAPGNDGEQKYLLRNARWPDYYVYVSNTNSAYVKKSVAQMWSEERFQFQVLSPPGTNASSAKAPIKLISPVSYPDATVRAQSAQKCSTTDGKQSCYPWYPAVHYDVTGHRDSKPENNPSLVELGLKLEKSIRKGPNAGRTVMMLGSPIESGKYLFVHHHQVKIQLYDGDPGANGYWYFEPELPQAMLDQIPEYSGRECFWWCRDIACLDESLCGVTIGPNGTVYINGVAKQTLGMLVVGIVAAMFGTLLS